MKQNIVEIYMYAALIVVVHVCLEGCLKSVAAAFMPKNACSRLLRNDVYIDLTLRTA